MSETKIESNGHAKNLPGSFRKTFDASKAGQGRVASENGLRHSLLPLNRGANGESVPRTISYGPSVTGGVDLDEMEFANFLKEVAKDDPLLATHLASQQTDHLREQHKTVEMVRQEIDKELDGLRKRSEKLDQEINKSVEKLTEAREKKLSPYIQKMEDTQEKLSAINLATGNAYSEAGASFDHEILSEEPLIRVEAMGSEESAWQQKRAHGGAWMKSLIPSWVSWLGTIFCGCLIGVSAALASGALHANDLFNDPKPTAILVSCLVGIFAVAIFLRGSLRAFALQASESLHLEQPRRRQIGWFITVGAIAVFLGLAVMTMDRQGLVRAAQAHSAFDKNHTQVSAFAWWMLTAALSAAYLLYAIGEGFLLGRVGPNNNAVQGFIAQEFRKAKEDRRADAKVQNALRHLSYARELKRLYAWRVQRVQEVRAPFDDLIAKLEAQRIAWPLEWTPAMKYRLEDARENLIGIQIEMNALISDYFARHYEQPKGGQKRR